ncbi:hypothetical protein Tco_0868067 [Tanacetum coccineum]
MEILIKTYLMPLALKTQNDSFAFVHELKQEMHADLKYVESLEDEIDELESDKAKFSNMYDMLLKECVSNDIMQQGFSPNPNSFEGSSSKAQVKAARSKGFMVPAGPPTPLDLGRCDAYGLVTSS